MYHHNVHESMHTRNITPHEETTSHVVQLHIQGIKVLHQIKQIGSQKVNSQIFITITNTFHLPPSFLINITQV